MSLLGRLMRGPSSPRETYSGWPSGYGTSTGCEAPTPWDLDSDPDDLRNFPSLDLVLTKVAITPS